MNLIHQGWSKDPGPPNGGEFPAILIDEEYYMAEKIISAFNV